MPATAHTQSPAVQRDLLEATDRALAAAHAAHVREAMRHVRWERRGLLQRLVRRAG
jgi:hypothetical protein